MTFPAMRSATNNVQALIDRLPPHLHTMVEVGVYAGESARLFIECGKFQQYVGVDTWVGMPEQEAAFDKLADGTLPAGMNVVKLMERSLVAASVFPTEVLPVQRYPVKTIFT